MVPLYHDDVYDVDNNGGDDVCGVMSENRVKSDVVRPNKHSLGETSMSVSVNECSDGYCEDKSKIMKLIASVDTNKKEYNLSSFADFLCD